tara:strand:+ start:1125 stop:1703 length:579 start_codon:yes stop_codon:yes gene_type:complete
MKNELIKNSIQKSIQIISTRSNISLADAWDFGTNVRSAFKNEPKMTHIALTALLKDAVDYLDMNKSFRHEGDYIDAVTYLIEWFPAMKLEEWKVICQRLKAGYYGKMYERLKLPELVEIFQQHEGERAEYMEKKIMRTKDEAEQRVSHKMTDEQKQMWSEFVEKLNLPEDDIDEKGRWKFIPHPNSEIKPEE